MYILRILRVYYFLQIYFTFNGLIHCIVYSTLPNPAFQAVLEGFLLLYQYWQNFSQHIKKNGCPES